MSEWKYKCLVAKIRLFLFKPNISQIGPTLSLPLLTLLLLYHLLDLLLHAQELVFIPALQLSLLVKHNFVFILMVFVCPCVIIFGQVYHNLLTVIRGNEASMLVGIARACLADERLLLVPNPRIILRWWLLIILLEVLLFLNPLLILHVLVALVHNQLILLLL